MTTYSLTLPDGQIRSRNSKKAFSHAIAMLHSDESEWFCAGYASSRELAEKAANAWASKVERTSKGAVTAQFQIIEVEVAA